MQFIHPLFKTMQNEESTIMLLLGGLSWLSPNAILSMTSSIVVIGYYASKWYFMMKDRKKKQDDKED